MQDSCCAYISMGSNMGDRAANLRRAADMLDQSGPVLFKDRSGFYMTEPVDYTDQEWFVNGVLKVETALDPFELLDLLKKIENAMGQFQKKIRFGPRIIDLDILYYSDRVIKNDILEIPHPRMHKRYFVLRPLYDIDRDVLHPVLKKTPGELLDNIKGKDRENQKIIPLREE
ncbi:MAG: 2-amino-4-hydroxy-6-hydroxymethyldihydropteridine diphosphokinase [Desulfobacteraceae bacterium]